LLEKINKEKASASTLAAIKIDLENADIEKIRSEEEKINKEINKVKEDEIK